MTLPFVRRSVQLSLKCGHQPAPLKDYPQWRIPRVCDLVWCYSCNDEREVTAIQDLESGEPPDTGTELEGWIWTV